MPPTHQLDPRLAADTILLREEGGTDVRLMNDRRWPWLILVPDGGHESFDALPPDEAAALWALAAREARILRAMAEAAGHALTQVNTASLGNVVRQLHVHVIARHDGDPNWPSPVWGFGEAEPYSHSELDAFRTAYEAARG